MTVRKKAFRGEDVFRMMQRSYALGGRFGREIYEKGLSAKVVEARFLEKKQEMQFLSYSKSRWAAFNVGYRRSYRVLMKLELVGCP